MVEVLGYACKIKGHHTIHCPRVRVKGDPTDIPISNRNGYHVSMDGGGGAPVRPSCVQAAWRAGCVAHPHLDHWQSCSGGARNQIGQGFGCVQGSFGRPGYSRCF